MIYYVVLLYVISTVVQRRSNNEGQHQTKEYHCQPSINKCQLFNTSVWRINFIARKIYLHLRNVLCDIYWIKKTTQLVIPVLLRCGTHNSAAFWWVRLSLILINVRIHRIWVKIFSTHKFNYNSFIVTINTNEIKILGASRFNLNFFYNTIELYRHWFNTIELFKLNKHRNWFDLEDFWKSSQHSLGISLSVQRVGLVPPVPRYRRNSSRRIEHSKIYRKQSQLIEISSDFVTVVIPTIHYAVKNLIHLDCN